MRDITKSFPGVKALDGVNLKVEKGTVHALMGENGAGKSTLMKILFGQQPPDIGTILFNGQEVHFKSVKEAVNAGISMIYQELSPIKELSIAENVFVGRYPKTRAGAIDWKTMYDSCQKIFDRWGLNYNPRTKIKMLKTADIQMIEIIKAISFNAQLVIMDEPTSSISQNEIEMLYDFIRALKRENITIIIITHKLDEVYTIADEVTVLRDGQYIGAKPIGELSRPELIKMMVGREMTNLFPPKDIGYGDVLLEVKNLNNGAKVKDISFQLHKGEILGFAGIVGASFMRASSFSRYSRTRSGERTSTSPTMRSISDARFRTSSASFAPSRVRISSKLSQASPNTDSTSRVISSASCSMRSEPSTSGSFARLITLTSSRRPYLSASSCSAAR